MDRHMFRIKPGQRKEISRLYKRTGEINRNRDKTSDEHVVSSDTADKWYWEIHSDTSDIEKPEDVDKDDQANNSNTGSLRTHQMIYRKACARVGVVPISHYIKLMWSPSMILRHHQLESHDLVPLVHCLKQNTAISCLDLSANCLDAGVGTVLYDMLGYNTYLTDLNLSENHIGYGVKEIFDALIGSTTLSYLNVSDNSLDDACAVAIGRALQDITCLKILNMSHNLFGGISGQPIARGLMGNSTLEELDLSWNNFCGQGGKDIAKGVQLNKTLKKLDLSWNGLGLDGAKEFKKLLANNQILEVINLTNRLSAEAAVLLSEGLARNCTIKKFKVGRNPVLSIGSQAICSAFLNNPASVIQELDFEGVPIDRDLDEAFKKLKDRNPDVRLYHGTVEPPKKPKARLHPMIKLQNYITKHNLKLIDFFQKFDKDGSLSVSYEEFTEGIQELGIKLLDEEVKQLLFELDKDGDGEINYSELVIGNHEFNEREKTQVHRFC